VAGAGREALAGQLGELTGRGFAGVLSLLALTGNGVTSSAPAGNATASASNAPAGNALASSALLATLTAVQALGDAAVTARCGA